MSLSLRYRTFRLRFWLWRQEVSRGMLFWLLGY